MGKGIGNLHKELIPDKVLPYIFGYPEYRVQHSYASRITYYVRLSG